MPEPNQQKIIRRAFELWQRAGCPEGKDKDLCRQAERELREAYTSSPCIANTYRPALFTLVWCSVVPSNPSMDTYIR